MFDYKIDKKAVEEYLEKQLSAIPKEDLIKQQENQPKTKSDEKQSQTESKPIDTAVLNELELEKKLQKLFQLK